jgi:hypothetical protein
MGRPVFAAGWLVLACSTVAAANPKTTKVTIETDPPGAKVYFGSEEDGEICTTPCVGIEAPVGETPIIIEAENRQSKFENLVIPRKQAKPYKFTYTLDPALGTVVVEGTLPAGATIKIDDEAKGKAPGRVENVPAGPHHVAIVMGDKKLFEDFIEVAANQDYQLAVPKNVATADDKPSGGGDSPGNDGTTAITTSTEPKRPEPKRASPYFSLSAIGDVGFRQFSYQNNTTPDTVRDESEGGQALVGPVLELYPTTLLGLHTLPGLYLYARAEFNVNSQNVTGMGINHPMSTFWQSIEVSVRHRWMISSASVEVSGGYTRDRYEFNGERTEITLVPDADYNAVKIGARGSLLQDWFEPYIDLGYRIVVSDSGLGSRYSIGHSVNGLHGALGAAIHVGDFQIRAEAALTMYTWTLKPDVMDKFQASGATDMIENLALSIGYAY